MAKTHLQLVAPRIVKQTVAPQRRPNSDYRTREHLTEAEIEKLIAATKDNRYGHRDATMILVAYRHGLRASELVTLRWDQIDFDAGILQVTRRKRGTPSTHPISGDELRALRRLKREAQASPFVFVSERGSPFSVAGFQRLVARASLPVSDFNCTRTCNERVSTPSFASLKPQECRIPATICSPPGWRAGGCSCHSCCSWGLLSSYSWMNYGFSNNLPFAHVAPARFVGDEPAMPNQNSGQVNRSLPIPDGAGTVHVDISRANGGFGPVLEPVEQPLCGQELLRQFGTDRVCAGPGATPRLLAPPLPVPSKWIKRLAHVHHPSSALPHWALTQSSGAGR